VRRHPIIRKLQKLLLLALAPFLVPMLAEAPRAPLGASGGPRPATVTARPASFSFATTDASASASRPIILWAWERPENLRFLNPRHFGVAALVATVTLQGEGIRVRPRFQPLTLPPGMRMVSVVRIELDAFQPPTWSTNLREDLVARIVALAGLSVTSSDGTTAPIAGVQIDFDAPRSARPFYHALLTDLRNRLPDELPLSMTALASWCLGDRWVDDLPVDEIVPMVFRMGADTRRVQEYLGQGHAFGGRCADAIGVATDEYVSPSARVGRRVYMFNVRSWTSSDVDAISEGLSP
jgi:hypothetical protein